MFTARYAYLPRAEHVIVLAIPEQEVALSHIGKPLNLFLPVPACKPVS